MWIIPVVLGMLAAVQFYLANEYRGKSNVSRFELFFTFGNLFSLAALIILYSELQYLSVPFYGVILPIFGILLFLYMISVLLIFVKFMLYVFRNSYMQVAKRLA